MCKIIFLHLKNIFVDQLMLFQRTLFKNTVTDVILIDFQYSQSCKKQGIPFKVGDIQRKLNKIRIKLRKVLVMKCQSSGIDIENRYLFFFEFNLKPPARLEMISIGLPQVIRVIT